MGRQIKFKVGIIGCGLIGFKRAKFLGSHAKLIACADTNVNNLKKISSNKNIKRFTNWKDLLKIKAIDIVIIATPHNQLSKIVVGAYKYKKHILVEKPGAKNFNEIKKIISIVKNKKIKIRVGYNHRYHPSILKAKSLVDSGALGDLLYIRGRYGHGGRLGYEKEWRAKKLLSGGGELLDQGSHLIDLSRLFLGEFIKVNGVTKTYFWNMSVEDNAFLTLETGNNKIAFLHASWTEWKNKFSFEIFGKKGKLNISGKGGSYGPEKLTFYKMSKKMLKPSEKKWHFNSKDVSWKNEINELYKDIKHNRMPNCNINDAYQTLKLINQIYKK